MFYDILLIGIIVLSVIIGYKKGAAKTILSAASILISAVLALLLSRILSSVIYDAFFKEALESKIESALANSIVGGVAEAAVNVVSAIPSVLVGAMSFFGLEQSAFENYCEDALYEQGTSAAQSIADKLSPVVTGLISIVLAVVLFFLLAFILKLLIKPISKLFRLPLIRKPDSLIGGLLGLAKGIIAVLIITLLLKLIMPFVPSEWTFLTSDGIEKSYLFSFVYDGRFVKAIQDFTYGIG